RPGGGERAVRDRPEPAWWLASVTTGSAAKLARAGGDGGAAAPRRAMAAWPVSPTKVALTGHPRLHRRTRLCRPSAEGGVRSWADTERDIGFGERSRSSLR